MSESFEKQLERVEDMASGCFGYVLKPVACAALRAVLDRLAAFERNEYICQKCWLRKDGEVPEGAPEF